MITFKTLFYIHDIMCQYRIIDHKTCTNNLNKLDLLKLFGAYKMQKRYSFGRLRLLLGCTRILNVCKQLSTVLLLVLRIQLSMAKDLKKRDTAQCRNVGLHHVLKPAYPVRIGKDCCTVVVITSLQTHPVWSIEQNLKSQNGTYTTPFWT